MWQSVQSERQSTSDAPSVKASVMAAPSAQTPFRAGATMTSHVHTPSRAALAAVWRCDVRPAVRVKKAHLVQAGVHTKEAEGDQSPPFWPVHHLHSAAGASQHLWGPLSRVQASHNPPVSPISQGGSSSLGQTQDWDA